MLTMGFYFGWTATAKGETFAVEQEDEDDE